MGELLLDLCMINKLGLCMISKLGLSDGLYSGWNGSCFLHRIKL